MEFRERHGIFDQYDFIKKSRVHDNVSFMLRGSSNNSTRLKPVALPESEALPSVVGVSRPGGP
jgi:hypothetical protein